MRRIISFGCGVNSVAMVIFLYDLGKRHEIIFSDTGVEQPETYCYLDMFNEWLLNRYGVGVTTVSRGESLFDYCYNNSLVPSVGFRWCTDKFKKIPIKKKTGSGVISLIGIAADEWHRAKPSTQSEFPLIENGIDRSECKDIIKRVGLEIPKKSGCYFCPFQSADEWKRLYDRHPALWEKAKNMEIKAKNAGRGMATFSTSGVTLEQLEYMFKNQLSFGFPSPPDEYMSCVCRD